MSSDRPAPEGSSSLAGSPHPSPKVESAARVGRAWLVVSLAGAMVLSVVLEEALIGDVWQLAASGAAVTLFMLLLALSFGLLTLKAGEPRS